MSLRLKLTTFYALLTGCVITLFSLAIYAQVEAILIDQFNQKLENVFLIPGQTLMPNEQGEYALATFLSFDKSLVFQLWDPDGKLLDTVHVESTGLGLSPIDPIGLRAALENKEESFREVTSEGFHYQVKTKPLYTNDETTYIGVLQVGTSLHGVDKFLYDLQQALIFTGLSAMGIAAVVSYMTTRQALSPLATVTRTASEITRADDLSRRIPEFGGGHDEVGRLIKAFNQTLERLEELFLSQRRFVADVGHELRTPLTVIKGNADLMRRLGQMDDQSLNSIEKEIDRLTRLVGDLLLIAKAEAGKLPLDRRIVELDTIMLEVCEEAAVLADGKKEIQIGEIDQVLVCGDKDRLKQVALNLVSNAVIYTQEGGLVELRLGKRVNSAYLVVQDNGPGIPEEDLNRIFERFYRGEKSRARPHPEDGKGFGLGLSIAYWIIYNHGGTIDVESQEGKGTTFTVWLPLADGSCP
jgi:two-component system OmpR family sensor kinase